MNKATKLPTILVFDSGVGGLTVYHEIKQLLPNNHYFYCLDNAFFPYSEKTEQQIIDRTLLICRKLVEQYPIDLVVIACNTASTVVLPTLRQHL
ncbi:glutamate racemase, partial [Testudinibacter sp. TR-2022]